ncbi:MAG: mevalonate kinase [Verrucomicrobiales bacterium]|jgi:mevalonate kinase
MNARSPGKLILSGEHAVVYGCPAIALALDCYAHARLSMLDTPELTVILGDRSPVSWGLEHLLAFAAELDERYRSFLAGQTTIEDVLHKPEDLFAYEFGQVLAMRGVPGTGLQLSLASDIPLGCGMGSSAALILAALRVLSLHTGGILPDEPELGLRVEHLQHGRSSGLDIVTSARGGMIRMADGKVESLPAIEQALILALTGCPEVSTGVCVEAVRKGFAHDQVLWQAFTDCTNAVTRTMADGRQEALRDALMENHRLLVRIGVVPERVQAFVAEIEACGGAAKICGAGSVKGDASGVVFVYGIDEEAEAVMGRYGYPLMKMNVAKHGTENN